MVVVAVVDVVVVVVVVVTVGDVGDPQPATRTARGKARRKARDADRIIPGSTAKGDGPELFARTLLKSSRSRTTGATWTSRRRRASFGQLDTGGRRGATPGGVT
jgi:hypothetical protein